MKKLLLSGLLLFSISSFSQTNKPLFTSKSDPYSKQTNYTGKAGLLSINYSIENDLISNILLSIKVEDSFLTTLYGSVDFLFSDGTTLSIDNHLYDGNPPYGFFNGKWCYDVRILIEESDIEILLSKTITNYRVSGIFDRKFNQSDKLHKLLIELNRQLKLHDKSKY